MNLTPNELMRSLRAAGYRSTGSRRAIVDAVLRRRRPFSSADILAEVCDGDHLVGRATVFRTLDALHSAGMLDRVEQPDGSHSYVLCPSGHHHHAICSNCGVVVDLRGCDAGKAAELEARAAGFAIQGHRLEFYGLCRVCSASEAG